MGRVQYAGRGLVHRLPWPRDPSPRAIVPGSVLLANNTSGSSSSNKGSAARRRGRAGAKRRKLRDDNGGGDGDDHDSGTVTSGTDDESGNGSRNGNVAVSRVGGGGEDGKAATDFFRGGEKMRSGRGKEKEGYKKGGGGHEGEKQEGGEDDKEELFEEVRSNSRGLVSEESDEGRCNCPCLCGRSSTSASSRGGRFAHVGGWKKSAAAATAASADLSRVEQVVSGAAMVRGCALGVEFVVRATKKSPGFLSVPAALDLLDASTQNGGPGVLFDALATATAASADVRRPTLEEGEREEEGEKKEEGPLDDTVEAVSMAAYCCGPLVALPRRFEVAAALHRLPGVRFKRPVAAAL